ncbi:MAG: methylmalonyl Co-A mutase-associated GTPase MeaB [Polyangiaceae bacterium]|nr:methylmalonyl Co-A mutase-associated GTPase MeaB [Polyangiaceae bacterium]
MSPPEAPAPGGLDVEALARGVVARERRALARAVTLVESALPAHQRSAERLLAALAGHAGGALRLGVSGVPGAGKSTLIETLGLHVLERGQGVAVLAIDPSSAVSGGSVLGDKTRMQRVALHERAFVRPSPSAGTLGGVARRTREAMLVCEAAGFEVVLVETVGVGQSEHAVSALVDALLLVTLAGAGDELQGIKRGILEVVDFVAVNKADGDGVRRAERAAAELRSALHVLRGAAAPPIHTVSAIDGRGVPELWAALRADHAARRASGELARRRARQERERLRALVRDGIERRFFERAEVVAELSRLELEVEAGRVGAAEAARRLLEL